jgi:HAMP domain-containing protein
MRWTIRKKLTSSILLLVLISIGFLGGPIYRVARKSLEERIGQGMRVQASSMINQIDRTLFDAYRNLQDWAGEEMMLDVVGDDSEKRISDFFLAVKKDYPFYGDLVFADNSGEIIASSNPSYRGKNVSAESWFKKTLSTREPRTLSASSTVLDNHYSTLFVVPVDAEKILKKLRANKNLTRAQQNLTDSLSVWKPKTFGVIAAFLNWPQMIEMVNGMPVFEGKEQTKNAYVVLMSEEGFALTQPFFENKAVILQKNFVEDGLIAAKKVLTGESGYTVEKGLYGKENIVGYAPSQGFKDFKGFGWAMLVFQSTEQALRPIHNLQFQIVLIAILVTLIASLISFLAARGITRPIEKLAEFMRGVGKGDFSKPLDIHSRDEIGMLAASFDEMLRNLKSAENEITAARDFTDNIIKSIGDALLVLDRPSKPCWATAKKS